MAVFLKTCCCKVPLNIGACISLGLFTILGLVLFNLLFHIEGLRQTAAMPIALPYIMEGLLAIIAFYGISKKKPAFMLPFLVLSIMLVTVVGFLTIWSLLSPIIISDMVKTMYITSSNDYKYEYNTWISVRTYRTDDLIGRGIGLFIYCVFHLYLTYVVYAYYCHLKALVADSSSITELPPMGNSDVHLPAPVAPPEQFPAEYLSNPPPYRQLLTNLQKETNLKGFPA